MLMEDFINTSNINEKWLNNIFENIKALENNERLLRDGCKDLLDFMNISQRSRPVVIGETQFKTLKVFITEFRLLLGDLTPILNDTTAQSFENVLDQIDKVSRDRKLFVVDTYDTSNKIISVIPTDFFWKTVDILHKTKIDLFKKIKNILYINQGQV